MCKAEWGGNHVCWWSGLYFCFICCLDEASCTGCYWWLGDARCCIQVVPFVEVLTICYSLGLVSLVVYGLGVSAPTPKAEGWFLCEDAFHLSTLVPRSEWGTNEAREALRRALHHHRPSSELTPSTAGTWASVCLPRVRHSVKSFFLNVICPTGIPFQERYMSPAFVKSLRLYSSIFSAEY